MKKIILILSFVIFLVGFVNAANLYVDDNDATCSGHSPCYPHVQDAVNAANPGDTINVYPGTYGSRCYTTPIPPHWGLSDQCAPALIVWKDNLNIKAVDSNPANTIIQTTHNFWSNKAGGCGSGGAIEHSTGCTWVGSPTCSWTGTCVRPNFGTAPNGIAIIANGVTIDGFTIKSTYPGDPGAPTQYPNTGGVLIGGLYSGDQSRSGIHDTKIKNSIIRGYSGVRLWKAPHTTLENNVIDNNIQGVSPSTPIQAAVDVWDGWNEGLNVGSTYLRILNNVITSYKVTSAISLGGYFNGPVDHSNLYVDGNTINSQGQGIQLYESVGTNKIITCNNIFNVGIGYKKVNIIPPSTIDGDSDGDGILDCFDRCLNSKPGESVDLNGCDPFQFCGQFYCGNSCYYADFKNDEPFVNYPHDCTVVIIDQEGKLIPKCVPTTCAD